MDGSHPIRVTTEGDHQVVHRAKFVTGTELAAFLRTLEPLDEEIGEIEDFPAEPVDL